MAPSSRTAIPDPRFFETLGPVTLREIARIGGAFEPLDGPNGAVEIRCAAPLEDARQGAIAYVGDKRNATLLATSPASAVFAPKGFEGPAGSVVVIQTANPRAAWARAALSLFRPIRLEVSAGGVHPSARLEPDVRLAPGVVIGAGAQIGRGTQIGAGSVIGPGVAVGRDCEIGAHVSLNFCLLGDRVKIYSGARIGEAGFGAVYSDGLVIDVPQLGRAILQDGVTVGANTCIDRGGFGDTIIGENTKIDNLCQIGHNVRLGRNCVMAAQTGLSGSVTVGDGVAFGGQTGLADHLTIGDGAQIAAGAGVTRSVPAGQTWAGYPAKPMMQWLRESAWITKLAATRGGKGRT